MIVRVWNKNVHTFEQEFEGRLITVPAGRFVEMDVDEARRFVGKYYPMEFDGGGRQKPHSFKMLVIDTHGAKETPRREPIQKYKCVGCGFIATDEKTLNAHIDDKHLNDMADADEREKRQMKRNKAS
jgi:hypothetical protein